MADRDTRLRIIVDAVNQAGGTFARMGRDLDAVSAKTADLRHGMMAVGAAGTAAFAGLAFMTKGIIQAGAGFEQTQIAFETMIGDSQRAKKALHDLSQFAARTPFELVQLEEASKRLMAYGVEVDNLIPTLRMLGDISAGVGMDKLPQLILAFGQVRAATKLTGMELRQFSEAGVPLLGTLAKQLGKTEGEILEMVSAGEIGFPMVQQALASLTGEGGKFFNLMERQSTSLGGLWSNLQDQLSLTARTIGEELMPILKPLVERLIEVVQVVGNFVKENPKLSATILIVALAITALMAVLLPLAIVLPMIISGFSLMAAGFLFVASGPGLVIIATVAAIGFALLQLGRIAMLLRNDWDTVWLGIKLTAAEAANSVISVVENMINRMIDKINSFIKSINRIISKASDLTGINVGRIGTLDSVDLGRVDTQGIIDRAVRPSANNQSVVITGNTFLSEDVAEQIGDKIMSRLKMSNAI